MNNKLSLVGDFCPNPDCPDYGKLQRDQPKKNIKKFGKSQADHQRFLCKTCNKTFTETKGTIFYGRRTADDKIIRALLMIAEGSCSCSVRECPQTGNHISLCNAGPNLPSIPALG